MLSTIFFLFSIFIIFFQTVESITVNEKSGNNISLMDSDSPCFTSNNLFVSNKVRVAFIDLNVLAPQGAETAKMNIKSKIIQSNKNLLQSLLKDKYNIFILSTADTNEAERFKLAFGQPSNEPKECGINDLSAYKMQERIYGVPSKNWLDSNKDTLLEEKSKDQFRRHGVFCHDELTINDILCAKQLSFKHVLNGIFEATGKKQGVKLLFASDSTPYMGASNEVETKNPAENFNIDITFVLFPGVKANAALAKKITGYADQGTVFTNNYKTAFSTITRDSDRHLCNITKKKKQYSISC